MNNPHGDSSLDAHIPPEWPLPDLREQLPYFIELLQHDPGLYPWLFWIIIESKSKTVIGDVGFKGRPDKDGEVEIGYSLLPEYRNQGYMSEAAAELIRWAFTATPVRRIVAECDVSNLASMRVLEKLGMKQTGRSGEMIYWRLRK
ncbi:GNAT family N-acetyltransferase [Chitinophaga vietnamensis]|uniref:GNAT family N-acetyltransferase n=1 Tax=Chitinophaga vietnamensis TaxID=2593957 RepID=UPI0013755E54|nr:GNAT family N-acetyltransferase [Chitinophaga vietnamensis]